LSRSLLAWIARRAATWAWVGPPERGLGPRSGAPL